MDTGFTQGIGGGATGSGFIEQHYDVEGTGNVAALGSQETHLRRGSRLAIKLDMAWNSTYCPITP